VMEGLTPGRIVHYVNKDTGEHQAAMMTAVPETKGSVVTLTVFPPMAIPFAVAGVYQSPSNEPGTWHWPERE